MSDNIIYTVFISSTFSDLKDERRVVMNELVSKGYLPKGMEFFPANNLDTFEYIKREIDQSDYYILISAGKYGSICEETGISYTEMEYDYAVGKNIPVASLLLDDKYIEPSPALKAFRDKVTAKKMCKFFETNNMESLAHKVIDSIEAMIKTTPNGGWCRANVGMEKNNVQTYNIKGDNAIITNNNTIKSNDRVTSDLLDKSKKTKSIPRLLKNQYGLINIFNTRAQLEEELLKAMSNAKKEVDMICGCMKYSDFENNNKELINKLKDKDVTFRIYDPIVKKKFKGFESWLLPPVPLFSFKDTLFDVLKISNREATERIIIDTAERMMNFYCRIDDVIFLNLGPKDINKLSNETISFSFKKGIVYDVYCQYFNQLWKKIRQNLKYSVEI